MQIKINYPEIQDAVAMRFNNPEIQNVVAKKFNKQIELYYVDAATVKVTYTMKWGLSKSIGVNLKVERIEGTDLYLSYSGSLGIELVIAPFLSFVKRLLPEKTEFIQEQGNHIVMIRLAEIEKLRKALDVVKLERISFDNDGVIADVVMR